MDQYQYNPNSPFSLRLELLKLAQSIESDRIWSERNRLEQDWHQKVETNGPNGKLPKTINPIPYPELPVVTFEQVIKVAEELNKFVSNRA